MSARTPVAYVSVAGVCIVLHNAVMIGADYVSFPLWLSVLISFSIVATAGYVLHGILTFRQPLSVIRFGRYALAMSANIPLAYVTTWFWHDRVGLVMAIASPLASACMLVINFLLSRWAINSPKRGATVGR